MKLILKWLQLQSVHNLIFLWVFEYRPETIGKVMIATAKTTQNCPISFNEID